MNKEIIETKRLRLRRWQMGDLIYLVPLLTDIDVMKFSAHGPLRPTELETWLQNTIAQTSAKTSFGMRAIERKSDNIVIGYVNISKDLDRIEPGDVELGLRLAKEYWQRGHAYEAATAMINLAFEDKTISRVVGIVDPSNVTSINWLKKLGMTFERDIEFEGYDHPDHLYTMLAIAPSLPTS
ncbi:GNAT family N-acetyltransferase [Lentilitoribacter sp. Alg239-R112]|uniref:GNAT family N-acetyltransferase n=1 Tax=Lentilitoribacter sp. Alg239-R112 TaxID=2305987 RepID=UPI0013A6CD59|nr:GNAT family N-acetyltransferase [Lentilitoribacter sp. Alg239-R112]